VIDCFER